jgi:hypothetical protein
MRGLLIGPDEERLIAELRERAAAKPVNMERLVKRLKRPLIKAAHMRQMTEQTIAIPMGYAATYSIETGHPIGAARHLSVSIDDPKAMPHPAAVAMIAEAFGFEGGLERCHVWIESLKGHGSDAVNLVQPLSFGPETKA